MPNKYHRLLSILEPYIISYNINSISDGQTVFGQVLKPELRISPLELQSEAFIKRLYHMDQLTFADQGMGMEPWVFLDCSFMPSFAMGYCIHSDHLSENDKQKLNISEVGYYPVSMYIALPTMDKNKWFGHNLSSLNGILEYDLQGLGFLTKAAALNIFKIQILQGATQWGSIAIGVHLKFGAMKLLSAYTPIHSKKRTLCYETQVDQEFIESVINNKKDREVTALDKKYLKRFEISCHCEVSVLIKLQQEIQAGEKYFLTSYEKEKYSLLKK